MNINKKIKLIFALCASVTLSASSFGIPLSQLDQSYDKLGFAYSTQEFSDLPVVNVDGFSAYWMTTGGSENWVSSVDFSYGNIGYGIIEAHLLSTAFNLGYRVKLSDSAELVPLIGWSYSNLSSSGYALADIWAISFGVSAKYALTESTFLGSSFVGHTGDLNSWISLLDGQSANSITYAISIEQVINDSASVSLSYATTHLGLKSLNFGFNILL